MDRLGLGLLIYPTGTVTKEHILHRRAGASTAFREIAPQRFFDDPHAPFEWIERGGETLAVKATPVPPDKPENGCHQCPSRFTYEVFRWDSARERFAPVVRVEGSEEREMDGGQIDDDRPLIERGLQGTRRSQVTSKLAAESLLSSPAPSPRPPAP